MNAINTDLSENETSLTDSSDASEDEYRPQGYPDTQLLRFIINGHHPFNLVDEADFKKLLRIGDHNYYCHFINLPNKKSLSSYLQKLYDAKKHLIIDIIRRQRSRVSLAIDFWTSVTNKTYIIVTAHFVSNTNNLASVMLEFDLIPFPNNSDQILIKLRDVIQEYGLKDKIISITAGTDAINEDILIKANALYQEFNGVLYIRCIANVLSLIVKQGLEVVRDVVLPVQKLVELIAFSSKNRKLLIESCKSLNILHQRLIKDTPIRWTSTYLMLKRALKMKTVLYSMCIEHFDFVPYAVQNWEDVEALVELLKPFHEAAVLLSKHPYPSLCYVIPILDILTQHLHHYEGKPLMKCTSIMLVKLNEYSESMKSNIAQIATILDPRVNNHYFISKGNTDALDKLRSLYQRAKKFETENETIKEKDLTSEAQSNIASSSSINVRKSLFSSVYKKQETLDEIDTYINMPNEPGTTDILLWWRKYIQKPTSFPILVKMAFDILPIPATRAPSKEVFSIQGDIVTKKRNRLSSNHIKTSMCLESWLKYVPID